MNKYEIRRAIISALRSFANPQCFDTILSTPEITLAARKFRLSDEDKRDIRAEWHYLIEKEYIKPVQGYEDYARLSSEIRSALDGVDPLTGDNPLRHDERLYGPEALR